MKSIFSTLLAVLLAVASLGTAVHAAPPDPQAAAADAALKKLRDQLRTLMTQLQTAEADKVALQTAKTELEEKNKELTTQIETMTKRANEEKTKNDKQIANLQTQVEEHKVQGARLAESLGKWKVEHGKVTAIATKKESERAKLASKVIVLERTLADRESRNLELYKVGKEVLDRYENFAFGRALLAREPFTSLSRVKLENLVQDYQDKLLKPALKAGEVGKPAPEKPAPASTPEPAKPNDNAKAGSDSQEKPAARPQGKPAGSGAEKPEPKPAAPEKSKPAPAAKS